MAAKKTAPCKPKVKIGLPLAVVDAAIETWEEE